jgi:outer membrane protein assembly factor BamE (lipoprotein component of BamABCDE complex)
MSTRFTRLPALLTTLVLAFVVSGCLIGTSSKTKYTGRYIGEETLKQIEPGDSNEEVFSLLGEPTTRTQKGSGSTIWKYAYTQATTKTGAVFLLIGTEKTTEVEGAVYVEFDAEQRVVKTWSER